jgi:hypothetical protein
MYSCAKDTRNAELQLLDYISIYAVEACASTEGCFGID